MSLMVIEGLDGSGKGTQTKLLQAALTAQGVSLRKITFPDYDSPSSALVKMYLGGEFGEDPASVNPYAAGAFYAVDRFASYKTKWEKDYLNGSLILCDRYATSNMVYQLEKLPRDAWDQYLSWAEDFEYGKLGLPKPDLVVFLDVPVEVSQKLLAERYHGDETKKDIHEKDPDFLQHCRETACYAASKMGWKVVSCARDGQMLSVEEIHQSILALTQPLLHR